MSQIGMARAVAGADLFWKIPAARFLGNTDRARRSARALEGEGAEGGYLRLRHSREGGILGCGVRREMPVPDGSIVQLNYVRA
jgi:hypothetical protein